MFLQKTKKKKKNAATLHTKLYTNYKPYLYFIKDVVKDKEKLVYEC